MGCNVFLNVLKHPEFCDGYLKVVGPPGLLRPSWLPHPSKKPMLSKHQGRRFTYWAKQ